MKLIQKKRFRGKRIFELKNGKVYFRFESLALKNEWFVNLSEIDSHKSEIKKREVGSWLFTIVFTLLFCTSLVGVFTANENSDFFAASIVFIVISPIPILLGLYKAIKDSYHWVVVSYLNGSPALYFYPQNPSKEELERFIGEMFEEKDLITGSGGEVQRAIESLNTAGLIDENEYQNLHIRAASKSDVEPGAGGNG